MSQGPEYQTAGETAAFLGNSDPENRAALHIFTVLSAVQVRTAMHVEALWKKVYQRDCTLSRGQYDAALHKLVASHSVHRAGEHCMRVPYPEVAKINAKQ